MNPQARAVGLRSNSGATNFARAGLDRDGYVVISGALRPAELHQIRATLEPLLDRTPTGRSAFEGLRTKRVYSLLAKTRVTDSLAGSELVLALCRELLGHHQLSAHVAVQVGVGSLEQELHTDDRIYPLSRPHDELVLSALWAIDAHDSENGATRVIPGSHHWGERSPNPATSVPVVLRPGSLLVYRGTLWHGVGANQTERPSLAVHTEYIASWLRPLETQLLAMPPERARQLPPKLQELLGYNIRPPFTGFVDGRHPRRMLK